MATTGSIPLIQQQIDHAMLRDRHRLRRRLKSIQSAARRGNDQAKRLQELAGDVKHSFDLAELRRRSLPSVTFPQDLPILDKHQEIKEALAVRQVMVVAGETGSGKSTQLPKICLEAGLGITGMIGHTQPRRIAARSVATRVAEELGVSLGHQVGFKIRFTDKTNPKTYVKLMTDGILLAETQGDRFLEQYEVIILDEAHERSMNIDFLMGYVKRLLAKRRELRVIVTSATIDPRRFSEYFADRMGPAPVIEVSGRTYPVEVRYRPLVTDEDEDVDLQDGIVAAVHELASIDRGHILIFLPTERDIRDVAKRLRAEPLPGDGPRKTEILPLYARLSAAEQNRVFQTNAYRRVVLATNVAESSLTVPGIRYVIDTGTARISRYAPRSKVQRLPIEAISQASADQRKGRCGRVAPGICIRLYSEADYRSRSRFTTPEIRRTNLASVILQATALKLGAVEQFPFLDPPGTESVRDGYKTLFEIGATDDHRTLTEIGRRLAQLPVDPRIGRIVLAADEEDCLSEMLIIAAALEVQDPRDRPLEKQQAADQQHAKFVDPQSDFLGFLKMWDFYHDLKESLSRSRLRKACRQNFLSYHRIREWTEIQRQLRELVLRARMKLRPRRDDHACIHRALLTGFLSGVAYRRGDHEYTGAGGVTFHLWPGSGLRAQKPKWLVAAEVVETTRRYGRTVARISPNWIEPIAEHLVKRSYSDPYWHEKSESVMAFETVTLFGLPVVARRRVRYGPLDPPVARRLFIQHGLVERRLRISDPFYRHNSQVLDEIAQLAAKTRNREYLVDDYSVYRFYDQRLPEDAYNVGRLRKWLRHQDKKDPDCLHMSMGDLVAPDASRCLGEAFPDRVLWGSMRLPVSYHFEPGSEHDGVTVTVPAEGVSQLREGQTGWLVPGLLEEKITALIRALPKSYRRKLIPAPDTAKAIAAQLMHAEGPFLTEVLQKLSGVAGEPIPEDAIPLEKLPDHLQLNIRVVDSDGQVQVQGRDLRQIVRELAADSSARMAEPEDSGEWNRDGITSWDFGALPEEVILSRNGINISAYPTLIDAGESVQMRLSNTVEWSTRLSRHGVMRLYAIAQKRSLRTQVRWLPRWEETCLFASAFVNERDLRHQLQDLIAHRAFVNDAPLPRSGEEFAARLHNAVERISMATQEIAGLIPRLFAELHKARLAMERTTGDRLAYVVDDVAAQLSHLTSGPFLVRTDWRWLCQYPKYFQAITHRLDKLTGGPHAQDRHATSEIAAFWTRYQQQHAENENLRRVDPELEHFRWMLEEYRVSLFAQRLGTATPVSSQRLEKQWAKVRRG